VAKPARISDAALMKQVAGGDMPALGELVRRHQAKVLALAIRTLGREDLAEDVAQDVFVRVYKAAPKYTPDARFTTWLYRITLNRCMDVLRRNKRQTVSLDKVADVAGASGKTDDVVRSETAGRVRKTVDALPDRQRLAVILHRYQDLSHHEIAETTGWSRSAVESLLVRAYANLRKALADLG